jgi:hypothetical protein
MRYRIKEAKWTVTLLAICRGQIEQGCGRPGALPWYGRFLTHWHHNFRVEDP